MFGQFCQPGYRCVLGLHVSPLARLAQDHYYIYPLLYWLEIVTDFLCLEASSFDVAYMSEIDPLWQDDELTTLLNPEAALFTSPIAQAACSADCLIPILAPILPFIGYIGP